jgi:hypothetical protein
MYCLQELFYVLDSVKIVEVLFYIRTKHHAETNDIHCNECSKEKKMLFSQIFYVLLMYCEIL